MTSSTPGTSTPRSSTPSPRGRQSLSTGRGAAVGIAVSFAALTLAACNSGPTTIATEEPSATTEARESDSTTTGTTDAESGTAAKSAGSVESTAPSDTTAASTTAEDTNSSGGAAKDEDVDQTRPMGSPDGTEKRYMPDQLGQLIVKQVRVQAHEGFDRVVIDLEGEGEPGWLVSPDDAPAAMGSGFDIELPSAAGASPQTGIQLMLHGTPVPESIKPGAGFASIEQGVLPDSAGGIVTGVYSGGIFEADQQFVIGLTSAADFSVSFLEGPKRVVVDIVAR